MLTKQELAQRLMAVNVEDVAREAAVSTKTIYRLRHGRTEPRLTVLNRLLEALDRLEAKEGVEA